MKCSVVKKLYGLPETDPQFEAAQAHLRGCAQCRAVWDDQRAMHDLLGLKNYEQPAPDFEARCLASIHRELVRQPAPSQPWQVPALGWLQAQFIPVRLAAAAAVLVLAVGVYLLGAGSPPASPVAGAGPLPALTLNGVTINEQPAPAPLTPSPVVLASTNQEPLRMDYGPGASVPVNFNY